MTIFSFLSSAHGPWIATTRKSISKEDIPTGILLLELDAVSMIDLDGLYRELSSVFEFPEYFGKNFNALDECLTDLEWLSADGYFLIIRNSEYLLNQESDDMLHGILSILDNAGKEWASPICQGEEWDREGVPFHTILISGEGQASALQMRLKKIGFEIANV